MSPVIYNINNAVHREKMAAFDYDWTLVCPKDGKTFPTNVDDWEWLHSSVPDKLKKYHDDGYMIVVFTNQSKQWKHEQINYVMKTLNIPAFIVIATDKLEYKPNRISFDALDTLICNNAIDLKQSFFVGDALGRKTDFSDSDKVFAQNIGVAIYAPEEIFGVVYDNFTIPDIPLSEEPEIIIMMGYPGSGKSTIAKEICKKNAKYICIEGDVYKTSAKMIKASIEHMKLKKSIVFDATNSSSKKRKEYIDHALKYRYSVKCIHVSSSLDVSYKRNLLRPSEKQVPKIAYSVYKKHFESPDENEGFQLVVVK